MKFSKMACTSLLALGMSCVSAFAHADSLTIVNNTDHDSTSKINGGMCSNSLPGGVTKAHSTNVVSSTVIGMACFGHSSDCKADVYMSNDCSGSLVSTIIFDTKKGIKSIDMHSADYSIKGSGFTVELNGGKSFTSN